MKTQPQANDEMRRLAEHLEGQRTAMLSFADEHGQITARPMTALEMDEHGEIWMMVSRQRMAPHFVAALRQANLGFSDEHNALYVSIAGVARLCDDVQRKQALWSAMARPWFADGAADPDLVLLALQPQLADIWDGPDNDAVRLLALTASIAASRPIGLGEHEVIKASPAAAPVR